MPPANPLPSCSRRRRGSCIVHSGRASAANAANPQGILRRQCGSASCHDHAGTRTLALRFTRRHRDKLHQRLPAERSDLPHPGETSACVRPAEPRARVSAHRLPARGKLPCDALELLERDDDDIRFHWRSSHDPPRRSVVRGVRPDAVILDCRLPDGDGLTLVNRWRDHVMAGVPVVVVTAHRERQDVDAALLAGADYFVPKPCSGSELAAHVARALSTRTPSRRLRRVIA